MRDDCELLRKVAFLAMGVLMAGTMMLGALALATGWVTTAG